MGLLQVLFSFSGRIGRTKFWLGYLAAKIILFGGGAAVIYYVFMWLPLPVWLLLWLLVLGLAPGVKEPQPPPQRQGC